MAVFAELRCTLCETGDIPFDREEIAEHHCQLPDWKILEEEGIHKLCRTFKFRDAKAARRFESMIMEIADEQGHHPKISAKGTRITLIWWTHVIGGLHENDFIMAARSDQAYKEGQFEAF